MSRAKRVLGIFSATGYTVIDIALIWFRPYLVSASMEQLLPLCLTATLLAWFSVTICFLHDKMKIASDACLDCMLIAANALNILLTYFACSMVIKNIMALLN